MIHPFPQGHLHRLIVFGSRKVMLCRQWLARSGGMNKNQKTISGYLQT